MPSDHSPRPASPPSGSGDKPKPRPLLAPPPTIISPPSPIEQTTGRFHDPFPHPAPSSDSSPPSEPASPAPTERPRAPSDSLGPIPLAATFMSTSPGPSSPIKRDSLIPHPQSPDPSGSGSGSRPALSPRSPSPSSPGFRPVIPGNRRESSTHKVRETTNAHQSSTEKGERLINQYRIGQKLGKGSFATVELGVDVGTGQEYAIKEFSKSRLHYQALQEKQRQMTRSRYRRAQEVKSPVPGEEGGKRKIGGAEREGGKVAAKSPDNTMSEDDPLGLIRREIAVMKKLDHPNIVQLYEVISVPNADSLFLVLEYLPGGVLMHVELGAKQAHDPPFSMDQTREYFRQLCLGLEYLHANEVVHRDVKPDNILLSADRSTVKLCDFGVSEMFMAQGDDRIKKSGGSPAFLSPESFTSHIHEIHGKAVDIWALGVTLYCMLSGDLPFNVANPMDLFDLVKGQDPDIPEDWDPALRELMKGMMCKSPEDRISMADIKENGWVCEHEPMISTEDNLYHVGKHVEEPSQEELNSAIGSLRGVFTVIRAIQKMRRLQLHRRSLSGVTPSSPGSTTAVSSMDSYTSGPPGTDISSISDMDEQRFRDLMGGAVASPKRFDTPLEMNEEDENENEESPSGDQPQDSRRDAKDEGESKPDSVDSPTRATRKAIDKLRIHTSSPFKGHREESDKTEKPDSAKPAQKGAGGEEDVVMVDSPVDEVQSPTQMVDSPVDEVSSPVQMVDSPVAGEE